MKISSAILFFTLLILFIHPIFSSSDQSVNLYQQKNGHLIFPQRSIQDSAKQVQKRKLVKPKNHTELWFIGIGSPTALLGILGAVWPAIVFFVIAFALILLAISLEIFDPDDYILWNINEIGDDHIIFWIALVFSSIAIAAGIIILIGQPFFWIGLGIAAIGMLWWTGKTIRRLFHKKVGHNLP